MHATYHLAYVGLRGSSVPFASIVYWRWLMIVHFFMDTICFD